MYEYDPHSNKVHRSIEVASRLSPSIDDYQLMMIPMRRLWGKKLPRAFNLQSINLLAAN